MALLQRSFADGRLHPGRARGTGRRRLRDADHGPATRSHRRSARRRAAAATAGHDPGPAPLVHPAVRLSPRGRSLLAAISPPNRPAAGPAEERPAVAAAACGRDRRQCRGGTSNHVWSRPVCRLGPSGRSRAGERRSYRRPARDLATASPDVGYRAPRISGARLAALLRHPADAATDAELLQGAVDGRGYHSGGGHLMAAARRRTAPRAMRRSRSATSWRAVQR